MPHPLRAHPQEAKTKEIFQTQVTDLLAQPVMDMDFFLLQQKSAMTLMGVTPMKEQMGLVKNNPMCPSPPLPFLPAPPQNTRTHLITTTHSAELIGEVITAPRAPYR